MPTKIWSILRICRSGPPTLAGSPSALRSRPTPMPAVPRDASQATHGAFPSGRRDRARDVGRYHLKVAKSGLKMKPVDGPPSDPNTDLGTRRRPNVRETFRGATIARIIHPRKSRDVRCPHPLTRSTPAFACCRDRGRHQPDRLLPTRALSCPSGHRARRD